MRDKNKTKEQLIAELLELRQRITEREVDTDHKHMGGIMPAYDKPSIPDVILAKWQKVVDLVSDTIDISAGLVMRVHPTEIEVFVSSNTEGNPYKVGDKEQLNLGLYCETVMNERAMLLVPDALEDPEWDHNPDIKLNMISYLGFPLTWPDDEIFGTICVLDNEKNTYSVAYQSLMQQFAEIIKGDLRLLDEIRKRQQVENELQQLNAELEQRVTERTAELTRANIQLQQEIAERKQMENEREDLITKLGIKNAELERFTYTVSHDLKSPIITIKGFLGFLEKDALEGNLEAMKNDIAFITDATDTMNQLLGELLELSRIGYVINPFEEISIEVIVSEVLDLISNPDKRDFSLELMPNLPTIYADRVRILQVFENLIGNAIKYSRHKPNAQIEIGVRGGNGEIVIYVQDNGVGIDPKYHDNIFGLFNQLDQSIEGTGTGLAIVKRIIEAHNGHIWVESDGEGQGTTFCFTLPKSDHNIK